MLISSQTAGDFFGGVHTALEGIYTVAEMRIVTVLIGNSYRQK